jgi:hypothetical protein
MSQPARRNETTEHDARARLMAACDTKAVIPMRRRTVVMPSGRLASL